MVFPKLCMYEEKLDLPRVNWWYGSSTSFGGEPRKCARISHPCICRDLNTGHCELGHVRFILGVIGLIPF